jgi:GntR family transcriptional regulator, vanillate catabolism transcriptional regulator
MDLKKLHKSLGEKTYDVLREMIIYGKIKADTRLIEDRMASELGVSRTTIKQAFIRLKEEGLLREVAGHGIQVNLLSKEEVLEAYEFREVLEGLTARMAAGSLSSDKVSHMIQEFEKLKAEGDHLNLEELDNADLAFHATIAECTLNKLVLKLIFSLLAQIFAFHGGFLQLVRYIPPQKIIQSHLEILSAIKNHDAPLAESLMRKHVNEAKDAFLNIFSDQRKPSVNE